MYARNGAQKLGTRGNFLKSRKYCEPKESLSKEKPLPR